MSAGRPMRPSHDSVAAHEAARTLAAERLDGSLDIEDAAWLQDHLATCPDCAAAAAGYDADHFAVRALRDHPPLPPRDLWARTSAAIEREAGHRPPARGRQPRFGSFAPYALLTGALVVAVVVGSAISSRRPGPTATPASPDVAVASGTGAPGGTPIVVGSKTVEWVSTSSDGSYELSTTSFGRVCPESDTSCDAPSTNATTPVAIATEPKAIISSPDKDRLVVVGGDEQADAVYVVALPKPAGGRSPAPSSENPTSPPPGGASATPAASPTATPTSGATTPTPPPAGTATPVLPTPTPTPAVESPAPPSGSLEPTASPIAAVAIATDVQLVGDAAGYSPDGSWFAFTARPADGSTGPDIYVWHVGDALAHPVTSDHASVFGSWSDNRIAASRAVQSGDPDAAVQPSTFLLDPETGAESELTSVAWRPVVSPTGDRAVFWTGTVRRTDDGSWVPADGRLVLADMTEGSTSGADTILDGPITDWDARWDETGTRLALWVADADDPTTGKLSLFVVDPATGKLDADNVPLARVPAQAGFSLGDGRLAWASPDDPALGEGRIQILAWAGEDFGQIESQPGEVVFVR
jgi:hypothetical protein